MERQPSRLQSIKEKETQSRAEGYRRGKKGVQNEYNNVTKKVHTSGTAGTQYENKGSTKGIRASPGGAGASYGVARASYGGQELGLQGPELVLDCQILLVPDIVLRGPELAPRGPDLALGGQGLL